MEPFVPGDNRQFRPDVPFNERWELLKPVLEPLYHTQKLPDIMRMMKEQYGFDADEAQYKYRFLRKWGWRKNIPAAKKAAIIERGQTRAALGKSTTATFKGRPVDPKKLRRQVKEETRKQVALKATAHRARDQQSSVFGSFLPFGNRIFLNWNMPYGAMGFWSSKDQSSPFGPSASTPSDINMQSPPADAASPRNAPSPLTMALKKKTAVDRARLLMQGRFDDLVRSMDNAERKITSTWLYQFWLFSFTTAKYWGRGPRNWTADNLGFNRPHNSPSISHPNTPRMIAHSPEDLMDYQTTVNPTPKPSPLCRWSIHINDEICDYEEIPSPPPEPREFEPDDEASWAPWPKPWREPPFEDRLRNGLASNDFSSIRTEKLPLAVPQLAKATEKSPNELLEESLGFAIMGHNFELVDVLAEKVKNSNVDISSLYPYHLATSYLDGSRACCNVLDLLSDTFSGADFSLRKLYVNSLGHTVLDNLMIAILKGHTSATPGMVDDSLKTETRFPGEEVDLCGRWDADSHCYRTLLENGRSSIPFEWKHTFCHTSVLAICHCITSLSGYGSDINAQSGLFLRHCSHCGQKLQLLPLHTLVLTASLLAQCGCSDEDLFGMLACLLCLVHEGANPLLRASLSLELLFGIEQSSQCSHDVLTPLELAQRVSTATSDKRSRSAEAGWQIFCHVLHLLQDALEPRRPYFSANSQAEDSDSSFDETEDNDSISEQDDVTDVDNHFHYSCDTELGTGNYVFGRNKYLGHIWAAVQTELLNYRRLKEEDAWNSENFDMVALRESLRAGTKISIKLVEEPMMNPYCRCGRFEDSIWSFPLREDVADYYFSNLDDWNRTTFIPLPPRCS